jgi:glutamate-1-semialdehyde 2,1-aminomutase
MNRTKSKELYDKACEVFPGGVNSPVRAFKAVDDTPFFIKQAKGACLTDVDGNEYIDFVLSWGPLTLGHAHPKILAGIAEQAEKGTSYGACCELEYQLASKIKTAMPSLEMFRFVNSGTEAALSVIRLARAFTGKSKIIKFSGCYHGHVDSLLASAGSGVATLAIPSTKGVTGSVVEDTIVCQYNNVSAIEEAFSKYASSIAAVIVEPVVGNAGFILPKLEFLQALRSFTSSNDSLLIFDEVMTGFRVAFRGAQSLYNIQPDLTMLGKVIGGGLPVGAFGGRSDIMSHIAPLGSVYQAGTLSGNPLAMRAGLETLSLWESEFESAAKATSMLCNTLQRLAEEHQISLQVNYQGTMFGFFFSEKNISSYEDALNFANSDIFKKFFHLCLENGLYFAPSPFEAGFVSSAHADLRVSEKIEMSLSKVFSSLKP